MSILVGRDLILLLLSQMCLGDFVPSFLWDPKNVRFNKDTCKDGNQIQVKSGDILNLVCPTVFMNNQVLASKFDKSQLYFNMYMTTDRDALEHCDAGTARFVYNCRPSWHTGSSMSEGVDYAIINFRPMTNPSGIAFNEGVEYHFFSTSNGSEDSLKSLTGGACLTHNMKLSVYYCRQHESCLQRNRINLCARDPVAEKVSADASTNSKFSDPYVILVLVLVMVIGCLVGTALGVAIKSRTKPISRVSRGKQVESPVYALPPAIQECADVTEIRQPLNGHYNNEQKFIV